MREQLYKLTRKAEPGDKFSYFYDYFIVAVTFLSVASLMTRQPTELIKLVDTIAVYILFADYVLHWITCDFTSRHKGIKAFLVYPFSPYAFFSFASLLPSMIVVNSGLNILRLFRVVKILSYSRNFEHILRVFHNERKTLLSVLFIALFYAYVSALAIFFYEPETFPTFFQACYWATTALTTVGYGDIYPHSDIGRFISMVSSVFGIAIIALPSGIVTAGFVEEIHKSKVAAETASQVNAENTLNTAPVSPPTSRTVINRKTCFWLTGITLTGVILNELLPLLTSSLNIPGYFDVVGTIFVSAILGPVYGLLVGLFHNFLLGIAVNNTGFLLYYSISAAVALLTGSYLFNNGNLLTQRILPTILLVIFTSSVLEGLITLLVYGDIISVNDKWEFYFSGFLSGLPKILAGLLSIVIVKTIETSLSFILFVVAYFSLKKFTTTFISDAA